LEIQKRFRTIAALPRELAETGERRSMLRRLRDDRLEQRFGFIEPQLIESCYGRGENALDFRKRGGLALRRGVLYRIIPGNRISDDSFLLCRPIERDRFYRSLYLTIAIEALDVATQLPTFLDLKPPIMHRAEHASGAGHEKLFLYRQRAFTQTGDIGRVSDRVAFKARAFEDRDVAARPDLALKSASDHETITPLDLATKVDADGDEQAAHGPVRRLGSGCVFRSGRSLGNDDSPQIRRRFAG
jgi:hypothetical protein